jgi:hypothetical protein
MRLKELAAVELLFLAMQTKPPETTRKLRQHPCPYG